MANDRHYRKNYISYNDYVEGNAVRKKSVEQLPVREPRTYVGNKRVNTSSAAYRNREKALRMSKGYVAILAVCCIAMVLACANYLSIRDDITNMKSNIATLELNVETLKAQNDALDYSINSYMDIENISKVASEQLGMIQAGKNQISFYESSESEYMKQYNDVPAK